MTIPDLTYAIIALATLAILAARYHRHNRRERDSFARTPLPPPGQP